MIIDDVSPATYLYPAHGAPVPNYPYLEVQGPHEKVVVSAGDIADVIRRIIQVVA